jgi:hypothetical protein
MQHRNITVAFGFPYRCEAREPALACDVRSMNQEWRRAMAGLTRDEVIAVLGHIDDCTIGEIMASGATRQELAEAHAWLANDEPLLNAGKRLATGRVGRLVELLASLQEDEESLLESGKT